MFVRRKRNASGTSSVQVVMKERGRYVVVRSFGASSDEQELLRLEAAARDFIRTYGGQRVIDFDARTAAEAQMRASSAPMLEFPEENDQEDPSATSSANTAN